MEKRRSTMITGTAAFLTAGVLSLFSLLISFFQLSFQTTLFLLPFFLFLCWFVVRGAKGSPPTLAGTQRIEPLSVQQNREYSIKKKRYTLVAHPINHYGEKLRWCLDLIDAPYEESNVAAIILVFLRGRSVPWLVDTLSCSTIGNSDEALAYLFGVHVPTLPEPTRTLAHRLLQRTDETLEWETKLNNLGHLIQGGAYYHLLGCEDGETTITCWGGYEKLVPMWERLMVRGLYHTVLKPKIQQAFRHGGEKGKELQEKRMAEMEKLFQEVDEVLGRQKHLTGEELSYVDITFCSLIGPLFLSRILGPEKSLYARGRFESFNGLFGRVAGKVPKEMLEMEERLANRRCGQYVLEMYEKFRTKKL